MSYELKRSLSEKGRICGESTEKISFEHQVVALLYLNILIVVCDSFKIVQNKKIGFPKWPKMRVCVPTR